MSLNSENKVSQKEIIKKEIKDSDSITGEKKSIEVESKKKKIKKRK